MTRSRPGRFSERLLGAGAALLLFALLGGRAEAQEEPKPARVQAYRDHVARALEHWQEQNYPAARAEYQKAYNIQPQPILLFNIASTYRKEENFEKALDYYERYLEVAPPDDEHRSQAEWAVDFLEDLLEKKAPEEKESAEAASAGAARPGAAPVPPAGEPIDRGSSWRPLFYAGVATGAAGLLGLGYGLYEGKRAKDREDYFENLPRGYSWTEEDQKRFDEGQSFERRAIVFSILGGVAVATGAALTVIGYRKRGEEPGALSVVPHAGESQAGVSLLGRF